MNEHMNELIEKTKNEFLYAKSRMEKLLAETPEERLNWSPAPSARTPLELVGHTAWAVKSIHETLKGNTFAIKTPLEADAIFRKEETEFKTRERVLGLLNQNGNDFISWLDELEPDSFDTMVKLPFDLGHAPLGIAIGFISMHTNHHCAQLEYLQTVYGDRVWH